MNNLFLLGLFVLSFTIDVNGRVKFEGNEMIGIGFMDQNYTLFTNKFKLIVGPISDVEITEKKFKINLTTSTMGVDLSKKKDFVKAMCCGTECKFAKAHVVTARSKLFAPESNYAALIACETSNTSMTIYPFNPLTYDTSKPEVVIPMGLPLSYDSDSPPKPGNHSFDGEAVVDFLVSVKDDITYLQAGSFHKGIALILKQFPDVLYVFDAVDKKIHVGKFKAVADGKKIHLEVLFDHYKPFLSLVERNSRWLHSDTTIKYPLPKPQKPNSKIVTRRPPSKSVKTTMGYVTYKEGHRARAAASKQQEGGYVTPLAVGSIITILAVGLIFLFTQIPKRISKAVKDNVPGLGKPASGRASDAGVSSAAASQAGTSAPGSLKASNEAQESSLPNRSSSQLRSASAAVLAPGAPNRGSASKLSLEKAMSRSTLRSSGTGQ